MPSSVRLATAGAIVSLFVVSAPLGAAGGGHFMALAAQTDHKRMVMGGDCYNYAMLASGHLDIVCESNLKLHDWAALVPVVEGAGGSDWAGDPLGPGASGPNGTRRVLALGDPARLEVAVAALACGH